MKKSFCSTEKSIHNKSPEFATSPSQRFESNQVFQTVWGLHSSTEWMLLFIDRECPVESPSERDVTFFEVNPFLQGFSQHGIFKALLRFEKGAPWHMLQFHWKGIARHPKTQKRPFHLLNPLRTSHQHFARHNSYASIHRYSSPHLYSYSFNTTTSGQPNGWAFGAN